jgi:hypothetical protein
MPRGQELWILSVESQTEEHVRYVLVKLWPRQPDSPYESISFALPRTFNFLDVEEASMEILPDPSQVRRIIWDDEARALVGLLPCDTYPCRL